ncbi:MAG: Replication-associated recombination protein A [bacterium ADurb.Bin429]|nr:MAG: Replication-associated recombination protein A [bacterium ADurb.Bin429]
MRQGKLAPVPTHLRDASYRGAKQLGHGKGYKYPHDYPGHHTEQEYLPDGTKSQPYYEPSDQGYEKRIQERMRAWGHKAREEEQDDEA